MLKLNTLSDTVTVSPQIAVEDIDVLKASGYKSVVCNRPDREDAGQPDYTDIEAVAEAAGLECLHLPVTQISPGDAKEFKQAIDELPKPVFAYCRSGTRCATLWAFSQSGELPVEDILNATSAAGYDFKSISDMIENMHKML